MLRSAVPLVTASYILAGGAHAQEPVRLGPISVTGAPAAADSYLPETVSGATKIPLAPLDIPMSVGTITGKQLNDRFTTRIDDAIEYASGIRAINSFGTAPQYAIRGFTDGFVTLRNGIRQGGLGGGTHLDTVNVDRIEVLKGPNAVLYGGGFGLGGAVNVVTKTPEARPSTEAELSIGTRDFYRASVDTTGAADETGRFRYRLGSAFTSSSLLDEPRQTERFTVAPAFSADLGDRLTVSLDTQFSNSEFYFPVSQQGLPRLRRLLALPADRHFYEPNADQSVEHLRTGQLTVDYRFDDAWQLRQTLFANESDLDVGYSRLRSNRNSDLLADGRTLVRRVGPGLQKQQNYDSQTELHGSVDLGGVKTDLLFGYEFYRDRYKYENYLADLPNIDIFRPVYGGRPTNLRPNGAPFFVTEEGQTSNALYGQAVFKVGPVSLVAGGRQDWLDTYVHDKVANTRTTLEDSAFSPRGGVVWRVFDETSLYASAGRYFRPNAGVDRFGQAFEPIRGRQYEVGIKQTLFDGRGLATAALFEITRENGLTPDPANRSFSIATGEQRSRGLELEATGTIIPGWSLTAAYAYTKAEVTKDTALPLHDELVGSAAHLASLWSVYDWSDGPLAGWGIGGGVTYTGGFEATLPNTFRIPSTARIDALVRYRLERFELALNLYNLTNEDYTIFYPQPGFWGVLTLRARL